MNLIVEIALSTISLLIVAFITYRLGLYAFFKRREYENVRKRYLEECVDRICINIDYALGIYRNNWAKCLSNLKLLHNFGDNASIDSYSFSNKEIDQGMLDINAFFRLKNLVNSEIFWKFGQFTFAFVCNYNMFIEKEIYPLIKLYHKDPSKIKGNYLELYNIAFSEIMRKNDEEKQFYKLLGFLLILARILEKENLSFKGIDKFSKRKDIKKFVQKVEEYFKNIKDTKLKSIENKVKKNT